MPVMTEAPGEKKPRFKMKLKDAQYLQEYGGWLTAGAVVIVDEDTAIRWLENDIATQAGKDEQTAQEVRRAALRARLNPVEDDEGDDASQPPVARPATRQPIRTPSRRGRPAVAPELVGAGVVNSLGDVSEETFGDDEDDG